MQFRKHRDIANETRTLIVPEYWSEAKERIVIDGKQRTLKRFGWSDISEQDALKNAKDRVAEAAGRTRIGEKVRTMDHKISYRASSTQWSSVQSCSLVGSKVNLAAVRCSRVLTYSAAWGQKPGMKRFVNAVTCRVIITSPSSAGRNSPRWMMACSADSYGASSCR
ncbi:MAG: hypothetical protein WBM61_16540 [Woeseiaceae bacterium]